MKKKSLSEQVIDALKDAHREQVLTEQLAKQKNINKSLISALKLQVKFFDKFRRSNNGENVDFADEWYEAERAVRIRLLKAKEEK